MYTAYEHLDLTASQFIFAGTRIPWWACPLGQPGAWAIKWMKISIRNIDEMDMGSVLSILYYFNDLRFAVLREQNPPPLRKPGNRRFWALSGRSPICTNSSRLPFSVLPWPRKVWKGRLPQPWWKRMMKKRFHTASLTSSRCGCLCLFQHVFMALA